MSEFKYTSGSLVVIPQFTKDKLLEIYTTTSENLRTNVELWNKIPNIVELARKYFISCLNSTESDNITLHCLSDDSNIYAFCLVQQKGNRDGKPCYKLSSLVVNPEFKQCQYEKLLINNVITRFSPDSGCIYGFVPKSFKGGNVYFASLYEHNELSQSFEDFPEDPTAWLDDNGKREIPIDAWNCFWYPKKP